MASIDTMIDQEDWSHISEPALRKRIQNRNSQRKLRAKRKLQNQSIPFDIMPSTPAMDMGPDLSAFAATGSPLPEGFMSPMETLYSSFDFDLPSINAQLLDGTNHNTLETATPPTLSWTTDADVGHFGHDILSSEDQQTPDEVSIPLDPNISVKETEAFSQQLLQHRQPKSGDVHIYIQNPSSMTRRPASAASSGSSSISSNDTAPHKGRRSKLSTHMFSRGCETGCSSRNSPGTWKQSFRQWNRCTAKPLPPPAREVVATCTNCGHHVAVGEPPEPSQERLLEMLSECSPALAELAKQPNVQIRYGFPPSSNEKSAQDMTTAEEELEDSEEDGNAKPNYILIYTGHDRA